MKFCYFLNSEFNFSLLSTFLLLKKTKRLNSKISFNNQLPHFCYLNYSYREDYFDGVSPSEIRNDFECISRLQLTSDYV